MTRTSNWTTHQQKITTIIPPKIELYGCACQRMSSYFLMSLCIVCFNYSHLSHASFPLPSSKGLLPGWQPRQWLSGEIGQGRG